METEYNATVDRCKAYLIGHYAQLYAYASKQVEIRCEVGLYDWGSGEWKPLPLPQDIDNATSVVVWSAWKRIQSKYSRRYVPLLAVVLWKVAIKQSAHKWRQRVGQSSNSRSVGECGFEDANIHSEHHKLIAKEGYSQMEYLDQCKSILAQFSGIEKQVLFGLLFESVSRKELADSIGISERFLFNLIADIREKVEL